MRGFSYSLYSVFVFATGVFLLSERKMFFFLMIVVSMVSVMGRFELPHFEFGSLKNLVYFYLLYLRSLFC